ncbi:NAD(P)H-dependent flavin oxidoreductase [Polyangium mundeleinium]|uniref:Nitronate monooxygenase family protein n=1 Tax=Polyangium mundeleinium TaxID=2995306 RepID=A0ABT5F681_9BACT|nr:nitronate monooxygenase family protein [Polyangium mundeleinium]MDC0748908.1 nitronate monooxygenase family protein [Polyangium mundeleinium]
MPIPRILEGRLTLPVIGAPMFIVSGPELVIAQCKAGVVGSFPALNARPKEQLEAWITRIKTELDEYRAQNPGARVAPFAVNQIAHRSNDRLEHDVEVCVRHEVPIIITSLRPPAEVVKAVHSYGGIVLHDVINVRHAEKALEEGVDGLILVCAGAGGHAGALSPFALVAEVRKFYQGTVCLAGAISTGRDVLTAQSIGADLAYVGTRFIATEEANAVPGYKQMLIDTTAKDVVYSSLFTGIHGNYLKPSVAAAGLDPDNLPAADKSTMNFGSGGNTAAKAWRDIWSAGQGVGSITDAPRVETLVRRMRSEYDAAREDLVARSNTFRG